MNTEVVLAEYQALREELLFHQQQVSSIFKLSITAAVVVMSWGVSQKDWLVLLAPTPILLVSALMLLSEGESIFRISSYIRTRIEPRFNGDLQWETRVTEAAAVRGLAERLHNWSVWATFMAVEVASLYFALVYAIGDKVPAGNAARNMVIATGISCAAIAAFAGFRIAQSRSRVDTQYTALWEGVATPGDGEPAPSTAD